MSNSLAVFSDGTALRERVSVTFFEGHFPLLSIQRIECFDGGRGKAGWPRGKDVEPTFVATGVCEVGNAPETRVEDSATTNALAVGFHVESHGRSNAMFRALMRLKCTQGAEGRHRLTALRTNVTSEYAGSRCGCFVRFVAVASRVEVTKSMHSREPPLFVSDDAVIPQSRLGVRLGHVGEGGGCRPQAPHVINDQVDPWQTATFMLKSKDGLQRSGFIDQDAS